MPEIRYVQQDIFFFNFGVLAHACNTEGTMGSGIAVEVAKKFPSALAAYQKQHANALAAAKANGDVYQYKKLLLGRCSYAREGDLYIANMVTQTLNNDFNDKPTSLDAVVSCLMALDKGYTKICANLNKDHVPVYMPLICARRGKINWNITKELIRETLTQIPEVTVCVLPKEWKDWHAKGFIPKEPYTPQLKI